LLNLELAAGELLEAKQNAVTVESPERNSFEDQHVQGALEEFDGFFHS